MTKKLLTKIESFTLEGRKSYAVLIDPDKITPEQCTRTAQIVQESCVDFIFIGSSLLINRDLGEYIGLIRQYCNLPICIFPGNSVQIHKDADAILFLSLISGRNPEYLIGQHVVAAPALYRADIEVIPTGYMLVNGGHPTSVSYMSNTTPIPSKNSDIAIATALAGVFLGFKLIYVDAGSGASNRVSNSMISGIKSHIEIPLIVGGGIREPKVASEMFKSGADVLVLGNVLEKSPEKLKDFSDILENQSFA